MMLRLSQSRPAAGRRVGEGAEGRVRSQMLGATEAP
jgi:hypothetical protein